MGVGVYLTRAVLVMLFIYCEYQLCRSLFPARVGEKKIYSAGMATKDADE